MSAPLTLGTSGHIDHGKTALIRALTGVDTDRLPEERARGISIALGYASLTLPSGRAMSVIDVPGHERFVRTMVAGATGIDLYLMVIAADDGVMPQTREHAAVLRALGVNTGVVAITKSDLADPELAMIEASELLPEAQIVPVSAPTGHGLDELREALETATSSLSSRAEHTGPASLHVDRVFTIRGAGTVVTGTLWSGTVARGDEMELLPVGRHVRVRGVQVHDQAVDCAAAGQRVAVNLAGITVSAVSRGDVLASRGIPLAPTFLIDAQLELVDSELEHGDRVQVHHGTREAPARLVRLGGRFWQLRLEHPLVPAARDRLVIRRIAPPDTLGGGVVLDAHPRKHGPSRALISRLETLARGEEPKDEDGPRASAPTESPKPSPEPPALSAAALATERRLRDARFEPPLDSELDSAELAALRAAGRAIRVSKTLHYHPEALDEVRRRVLALAEGHGGAVSLADLRDDLGTSRKFAQALLEHLDAERVTIRRGDQHVLRRGARAPDQEATTRR
ncbi:MAG: selenocysteine-specific translation elongation factor [Actinomycetota bacterium]|nr:selenocysteine-specific translation elongation factor [Actinomycetota bacterium]